jgi:hypothetical protein
VFLLVQKDVFAAVRQSSRCFYEAGDCFEYLLSVHFEYLLTINYQIWYHSHFMNTICLSVSLSICISNYLLFMNNPYSTYMASAHVRSALNCSTDAYVMYDNDVIIMVTWLLAAGATYIIQS